jgi:hypothetical protein
VPELQGSAFGGATARRLLDMTTGLRCSESCAEPNAEIWNHRRAGNVPPRPTGDAGPKNRYGFPRTLERLGNLGPTSLPAYQAQARRLIADPRRTAAAPRHPRHGLDRRFDRIEACVHPP